RSWGRGWQLGLLVIGYSVTDRLFADLLHAAARRSVTITLVGDRGQATLRDLLTRWPAGLARPIALQGVEPLAEERFAVHGKVIVADNQTALVGSANFTT